MAKFHINPKGEAGECKAKTGSCPFGGEDQHHATPEAAREAFEKTMAKEYTNINSIYRKISDKTVDDFTSPVKERMLRDIAEGKNRFSEVQIGKVLSQDADTKIRLKLVETISSQKLIGSMAYDKSKLVRKAVAQATHNRSLLKFMVNDEDPEVRAAAAANMHGPRRISKVAEGSLAAKAIKSAKEARIKKALDVANG